MLWSVDYIPEGESGSFETGYTGRFKIWAWFAVNHYTNAGSHVRVMTSRDDGKTWQLYAVYSGRQGVVPL